MLYFAHLALLNHTLCGAEIYTPWVLVLHLSNIAWIMTTIYVTVSAKTCIVHTTIKNKIKKSFVKLHVLLENIHKGW